MSALFSAQAQSATQPDKPTDFLNAAFHRQRREQLRKQLPANSVAVFFANPVRNRANDVDFHYHQDPDFYYLTGYREPNAVLLVFSDQQKLNNTTADELIYVQTRDPQRELWNGKRLGAEGVKRQLGFTSVSLNTEFAFNKIDFSKFNTILLKKFADDVRDDERDKADLYNLIQYFKTQVQYPGNSKINLKLLPEVLDILREVKTPEEMVLLRKAITISATAQVEVMKAMKPDMSEAEIQGLHEYIYKKYGAEYEGYPSIVGGGNNGCVLHYIENDKPRVGNDLVLMDVGAEYHGYTADVTRTIPATGQFTPEQKTIYQLVYDAQEAAFAKCKAGTEFRATDQAARQVIATGLMKLGIIKNEKEVSRYFPHGTSHYIGLDVHDRGTYGLLAPNSVITVEPGVYIPEGSPCDKKWWGIAVRIEDDILITTTGWENLSKGAPRTIADIEAMMAQPSALDDFVLPVIR